MLRIDVITIFPELFEPFRRTSVLGAAGERGLIALEAHDLRSWTTDRHRTVDDIPYGGGPGMVMKPEPLVSAIEALAGPKGAGRKAHVALLAPQGKPFTGARANEFAGIEHFVLVSVDQKRRTSARRVVNPDVRPGVVVVHPALSSGVHSEPRSQRRAVRG